MNKLVVVLTKGLPGSGKSFWAKQQAGYKRISNDDLREMLDGGVWNPKHERFMLRTRDALIMQALAEGHNIIVDATHLNPKHEAHIRELVKNLAEVTIQDFCDVPLKTCIERDLKRLHSVGYKVIMDMYDRYLKPEPPLIPSIEYDINLPDCIICDLDGTIALNNWRSPYDASECEKDPVNQPIVSILRAYCNWLKNIQLIFVSGRDGKYQSQTMKWLQNSVFPDFPYFNKSWLLYMRAPGDVRKDYVIKQEIYRQYIAGQYNVKFVLDDRLQTCRMWHSLGLSLLRVGDPEAVF